MKQQQMRPLPALTGLVTGSGRRRPRWDAADAADCRAALCAVGDRHRAMPGSVWKEEGLGREGRLSKQSEPQVHGPGDRREPVEQRGPTVHQRVTQGARLAWVQVPRTFPARRGLGFSFRSQWGSVGRLQMLRASLRRWPGLCQRPCGVAAERAATPSRPERDGGGSGADGKTGQRDRPRGRAWEYGDREGARAPSGSFPGRWRGRRTRSAGWGRGSRGRVSGDGVRSAMPETVERDSRGRGGRARAESRDFLGVR